MAGAGVVPERDGLGGGDVDELERHRSRFTGGPQDVGDDEAGGRHKRREGNSGGDGGKAAGEAVDGGGEGAADQRPGRRPVRFGQTESLRPDAGCLRRPHAMPRQCELGRPETMPRDTDTESAFCHCPEGLCGGLPGTFKFASRLNHLTAQKNSSTGKEALTAKRPAQNVRGISAEVG
jgi:hypothetical protein